MLPSKFGNSSLRSCIWLSANKKFTLGLYEDWGLVIDKLSCTAAWIKGRISAMVGMMLTTSLLHLIFKQYLLFLLKFRNSFIPINNGLNELFLTINIMWILPLLAVFTDCYTSPTSIYGLIIVWLELQWFAVLAFKLLNDPACSTTLSRRTTKRLTILSKWKQWWFMLSLLV